jgi:hypothetical protein
MDALTIPVSIVTEFQDTIAGLDEHKNKLQKIFTEEAVGFIDIFKNSMEDVFGRQTTGILNSFLKTMINTGGNFTAAWQGNWDSIVSYGLSALQALGSSSNQTVSLIGQALSGVFQGFQAGGIWGAIGGGIMSLAGGLSQGPSNDQLLSSQGKEAAAIFGAAFDSNVAAIMANVAANLPTAGSGKVDVVASMFHPDTMAAVLKNIEDFGHTTQEKFANIFNDNVKPVLMTTLGYSQAEAAKMMQPLFQQMIEGAKATGESISPMMATMISWAQSLGAVLDIDVSGALKNVQQSGEEMLNSLGSKLDNFSSKAGSQNKYGNSGEGELRESGSMTKHQQNSSSLNLTINTDNPSGFQSYLKSGGSQEISTALQNANKYGHAGD